MKMKNFFYIFAFLLHTVMLIQILAVLTHFMANVCTSTWLECKNETQQASCLENEIFGPKS